MPLAHPPHHVARVAASSVETAVVQLLNRTRAEHGLGRLRFNRTLADAARGHSADCAAHGVMTHDASDGTPFAVRIRRVTRARDVGETIVEMTGHTTAQRVVRAWLNSPPHRTEILSPSYHRVGVGGARRRGVTVVTADFTS
jgi:uncharacterized protein YkwD